MCNKHKFRRNRRHQRSNTTEFFSSPRWPITLVLPGVQHLTQFGNHVKHKCWDDLDFSFPPSMWSVTKFWNHVGRKCLSWFQGQGVSAMGSSISSTSRRLGSALKALPPVDNGLYEEKKLASLNLRNHNPHFLHLQCVFTAQFRCYVDLDSDCPDVRPSNNGAPYAWSCR